MKKVILGLCLFASVYSLAKDKTLSQSDLGYNIHVKIEQFKIQHDGDIMGKGDIKVSLLREGLDPEMSSSKTGLPFGNDYGIGSIQSDKLFNSKHYKNSNIGSYLKSVETIEDLNSASFTLEINEIDYFCTMACFNWEDNFSFPLKKKNLQFDLKKLEDTKSYTVDKFLEFPNQNNKVYIRLRFTKD